MSSSYRSDLTTSDLDNDAFDEQLTGERSGERSGERTKSSDDTPPLAEQMRKMPTMLIFVTIVYVFIGPILMLFNAPFGQSQGQFLMQQLVINSSLLITLSVFYGIGVMAFPKSLIDRYQMLFLPALLIAAMWVKSYYTYYSGLQSYCVSQDAGAVDSDGNPLVQTNVLIWNTSKVPIAIFVTYIFVILFPSALTPFFQFFCGEEEPHQLVMYFAIGFWVGCAAWASEASCYFQVLRSGCSPAENIKFDSIDKVIATNDSDDDD